MLLIPISTWVLWRTKFGLRLRSCGENPYAAESLGVNVYRMKLYGVLISGALAGLAGAFLSIIAASIYREGQTAGRGFIGLATLIFGNYIPGGVAAGAALFGFADALQLSDEKSVRSPLLFVAVLLLAFAIRSLIRKRFIAARGRRRGRRRLRRLVCDGRDRAEPDHLLHAVRGHVARARVRVATAAHSEGGWFAVPARTSLVTGVDWEALRREARAMTAGRTLPTRACTWAPPARSTTAASYVAATSRTRATDSAFAPNAASPAISSADGGGRLIALSVVAGDGEALAPCGRCRQILYEHGGGALLVDRPGGPVMLDSLLPAAFGPEDVAARSGAPADG